MPPVGVVAAGHRETVRAAEIILREGGNAFDAVVAAHAAACACEPVLSSLGGGGFLLAYRADGRGEVYDFFVETPMRKTPLPEVDFYPIDADFGPATQEFHIGAGAVAVPGTVRGLFAIHRNLCTMPMNRLLEPAIHLARDGVPVNRFQAYLCEVVSRILLATPEARAIFGSRREEGGVVREGEVLRQPLLAETLEALGRGGDRLFYEGDIADVIDRFSRENGGHLRRDDLGAYAVRIRKPLEISYRGVRFLTNPPPSSGGILIGFALKLMEGLDLASCSPGTEKWLELLARTMEATNKARVDTHVDDMARPDGERLLDPGFLNRYAREVAGRPPCGRGTTHVSVMDRWGNVGSLTVSNGEGCGYIVNGTGIMLNNMLGEEDLNPGGFHRWPERTRMSSMMAPSALFFPDGMRVALGSGGSNRIRTAILQVLLNLIDFGMTLNEAVDAPRIHFEAGRLSVEGGFPRKDVERLVENYGDCKVWEGHNLFFGGVHGVMENRGAFSGAGDPRRDGSTVVLRN